jgi:predicted Rdx family selenoprotein
LLLTFPPPIIGCIALLPRNSEETAGKFRVWVTKTSEAPQLAWDRKVEGGFPELKVLVSAGVVQLVFVYEQLD